MSDCASGIFFAQEKKNMTLYDHMTQCAENMFSVDGHGELHADEYTAQLSSRFARCTRATTAGQAIMLHNTAGEHAQRRELSCFPRA